MFKRLTSLFGKGKDQGFTLIEMLIVILIIGILAAVGVPLYIGYTQDAKLAEGKALAGSVLTAMQACVQINPGSANCTIADVAGKVGLTSGGVTGDTRWTVSGGPPTLANSGGACVWGGNAIVVTGSGDVAGLSATISFTGGNVRMTCNTGSASGPC